MTNLPDPKTLVDSIADGAMEVAEGPARVAKNVAGVAETFASDMKSTMDNFKNQMPDNPAVIPDTVIKAAGQTARAGLGMFEAVGNGVMDTFSAVKSQIQRVL